MLAVGRGHHAQAGQTAFGGLKLEDSLHSLNSEKRSIEMKN